MQLMRDVHSGEHENDFTGTPYVPVYVMLAVSGFFQLLWFFVCTYIQCAFLYLPIISNVHFFPASYTYICDFIFLLDFSFIPFSNLGLGTVIDRCYQQFLPVG